MVQQHPLALEASGRATEEGSLSQDGPTCNRCHMYRTEQQQHSLQIDKISDTSKLQKISRRMTEQVRASSGGA